MTWSDRLPTDTYMAAPPSGSLQEGEPIIQTRSGSLHEAGEKLRPGRYYMEVAKQSFLPGRRGSKSKLQVKKWGRTHCPDSMQPSLTSRRLCLFSYPCNNAGFGSFFTLAHLNTLAHKLWRAFVTCAWITLFRISLYISSRQVCKVCKTEGVLVGYFSSADVLKHRHQPWTVLQTQYPSERR